MSSDVTMSPTAAHVRKSVRTASTHEPPDPLSVSSGNAESTGNAGLLSSHHHSNPRTSQQQPQTLFHPHSSSFWHRWLDVRQMDLQSALDQMKTLLSTRPQTIYKTAYYRKQTKNHWYRDDPAFCLVQITFLFLASLAYAIAFQASLLGSLSFLLTSIVWNYLICGILMASLLRELANRYLLQHHNASQHVQRQQVEWLYAFDIHCNAFFPLFVVLYVVQFFALPLVLAEGWFPLLVANTLYAGAGAWYWYITHLGYRALPFLSHTEIFLFPISVLALLHLTLLLGYPLGFGWNMARCMARFYFM